MSSQVHTPEWVKDAIFYQIFPDRFAQSARLEKPHNLEPWDSPPTTFGFKGGDLLGVVEHLDYLQDLGVNAIYFTPIFQSTANHRYHTHDYFQVDPILGGNAAFKTLLDAAHARDMRGVIDGVFNHASRGFYQFNHTLENGEASPYRDWFTFHDFPTRAYAPPINYDAWWGLAALPKFNHANPQVREFIFRVAEHWVREGIDGWRLDVPAEIDDDEFWREFRRRVKAINPDVYIVGEIWHPAARWLAGDQFDAVMNYQFTRACICFFADLDKQSYALTQEHSYGAVRPMEAAEFARALEDMLTWYPKEIASAQLNLLDSHDTARFLTIAHGDATALRLALLTLLAYPGAPSIYYGDEIALEGRQDPDSRRAMIWDPGRLNREMLEYVKQLTTLLKKYAALRRGGLTTLHANSKVYAFARHQEG
ncbi:MAG: glycoside hydrolase family 13 protein, partial [Chloroflexota bacterium]|nr:glycoside hydrolase family 13 protein [Chloroflexota bacterium]